MAVDRNPRRSSRNKTSSTAAPAAATVSAKTSTGKHAAKKATGTTRPRSRKATSKSTPTGPSDLPSASSLLNNSRQTTDEWYKSARTKKGYGNYVKSGKQWLVDWTAEGRLDDEISANAFDTITAETPLALRALTAYKCEHLERGFSSAEGLRSAFKDYFERTLLRSSGISAIPFPSISGISGTATPASFLVDS
ncbi:hypothetical protein B0H11DRAFT_2222263 [Mycena galericulata]|nr:hypothetical protein B0H11DRAFT_2222263 [Mycena galericulata]